MNELLLKKCELELANTLLKRFEALADFLKHLIAEPELMSKDEIKARLEAREKINRVLRENFEKAFKRDFELQIASLKTKADLRLVAQTNILKHELLKKFKTYITEREKMLADNFEKFKSTRLQEISAENEKTLAEFEKRLKRDLDAAFLEKKSIWDAEKEITHKLLQKRLEELSKELDAKLDKYKNELNDRMKKFEKTLSTDVEKFKSDFYLQLERREADRTKELERKLYKKLEAIPLAKFKDELKEFEESIKSEINQMTSARIKDLEKEYEAVKAELEKKIKSREAEELKRLYSLEKKALAAVRAEEAKALQELEQRLRMQFENDIEKSAQEKIRNVALVLRADMEERNRKKDEEYIAAVKNLKNDLITDLKKTEATRLEEFERKMREIFETQFLAHSKTRYKEIAEFQTMLADKYKPREEKQSEVLKKLQAQLPRGESLKESGDELELKRAIVGYKRMRDAEIESQKKIIVIQKQLLNNLIAENEPLVQSVLDELKISIDFLKSEVM